MIKACLKLPGVAASIASAFVVLTAAAQTEAPSPSAKAKPKPKADSGRTIALMVTNKRKSGVVELDVALSGSPAFKPLLRNLAPGKQSVVNFSHDENCTFDFYVKYDDGATNTVPGVNVCEDSKLNLVE